MKLWGIFYFELAYHGRRWATWVYLAAFLGLSTWITTAFIDDARKGGFYMNAPLNIAAISIITSLLGLLVTAALASEAATRDQHTLLAPLHYTVPIGKANYLGGRLLGAFAINAVVLTAVPLGMIVVSQLPGPEAELVGPFRPGAYLGSYLLLALPNAFVSTALLFALAVLSRRALASYAGGVLLFVLTLISKEFIASHLGYWTLGQHLDPMGFTVMSAMWHGWTVADKNTRLIGLEGAVLTNRLLWLGVALGMLGLTYLRFRFAHHAPSKRTAHWLHRPKTEEASKSFAAVSAPISSFYTEEALPPTRSTRVYQLLGVARRSTQTLLTGWSTLVLPVLAVGLVLLGPELLEEELGTPSLPTTARICGLTGQLVIRLIVAALTTMYAGKLVWQERDAGLSELADTTSVPNWVVYVGKFLGLELLLVAIQALFMAGGMLTQVLSGYFRFELGLYLRILFGLRLVDYLLFVVLALAGHVLASDKYVGYLVVFLSYLFTAFAPMLGIEHHLLVYGSAPGWQYSDMDGFGSSLGPWLWFKVYALGWALLLGLLLMLFWVRTREPGLGWRLRVARRRFTRGPAAVAAAAVGLILLCGGFIFYNTNVLNPYQPEAAQNDQRAAYERRFGRYRQATQPLLTGVQLHMELYPKQQRAQVGGTYRLVNQSAVAIDSVHLAVPAGSPLDSLHADRPGKVVLRDDAHGYHILALAQPLQPGDTLRLHFALLIEARGFTNSGSNAAVAENGTFLDQSQLPAVGYQTRHELSNAGLRRQYGLPARAAVPSLHDTAARQNRQGRERIAFEAVIGTAATQTAVAPGALHRTWTSGGRRYFHYITDAPIRNGFPLFSASYAVHQARWRNVLIQIYYHPSHRQNLHRMVRSAQASLAYCSRQFGPYPHRQLRIVETPSTGMRLTSFPGTIMYTEGFAVVAPRDDKQDLDLPFAVLSHEIGHQWWGNQLIPASVEGAPVLTESLAWYSAMQVVKQAYGNEHLDRLLDMMQREYLHPREHAEAPLLRATSHFEVYRVGPFAMRALCEYIGAERVNVALRRLLRQYRSASQPLPVSLDLYRELQTQTPDSLHYLVHDLFAANTYWALKARKARAKQLAPGRWQVQFDVQTKKVTIDGQGNEQTVPMNDFVEIGIYAPGQEGQPGPELYRRQHRLQAGSHTITVEVAALPAFAGIDPRQLLIDRTLDDNFQQITLSPKQ